MQKNQVNEERERDSERRKKKLTRNVQSMYKLNSTMPSMCVKFTDYAL